MDEDSTGSFTAVCRDYIGSTQISNDTALRNAQEAILAYVSRDGNLGVELVRFCNDLFAKQVSQAETPLCSNTHPLVEVNSGHDSATDHLFNDFIDYDGVPPPNDTAHHISPPPSLSNTLQSSLQSPADALFSNSDNQCISYPTPDPILQELDLPPASVLATDDATNRKEDGRETTLTYPTPPESGPASPDETQHDLQNSIGDSVNADTTQATGTLTRISPNLTCAHPGPDGASELEPVTYDPSLAKQPESPAENLSAPSQTPIIPSNSGNNISSEIYSHTTSVQSKKTGDNAAQEGHSMSDGPVTTQAVTNLIIPNEHQSNNVDTLPAQKEKPQPVPQAVPPKTAEPAVAPALEPKVSTPVKPDCPTDPNNRSPASKQQTTRGKKRDAQGKIKNSTTGAGGSSKEPTVSSEDLKQEGLEFIDCKFGGRHSKKTKNKQEVEKQVVTNITPDEMDRDGLSVRQVLAEVWALPDFQSAEKSHVHTFFDLMYSIFSIEAQENFIKTMATLQDLNLEGTKKRVRKTNPETRLDVFQRLLQNMRMVMSSEPNEQRATISDCFNEMELARCFDSCKHIVSDKVRTTKRKNLRKSIDQILKDSPAIKGKRWDTKLKAAIFRETYGYDYDPKKESDLPHNTRWKSFSKTIERGRKIRILADKLNSRGFVLFINTGNKQRIHAASGSLLTVGLEHLVQRLPAIAGIAATLDKILDQILRQHAPPQWKKYPNWHSYSGPVPWSDLLESKGH